MNDTALKEAVTDLTGEFYIETLKRLHTALMPKTYIEIGVFNGQSLALARCQSIAIDPHFQITPEYFSGAFNKPRLHLYQSGSDDFFADVNPTDVLGRPVDIAFLDGMHRCEYLLRDFINTERHCRPNSIIALHDCLPVEVGIATRDPTRAKSIAAHRRGWWTGDVWRTSLLLKRYRPDLSMTVMNCAPTGLVLITNLDPTSTKLSSRYAEFTRIMLNWDLATIGVANLFAEMQVEPSSILNTHENITERFWL